MLKVGVIGYGTMGRVHASCYQRLPSTELVAVADVEEDKQRQLGELDVEVFPSGEELIRGAAVDLVDVCLPTHLHRDMVVSATEAGKHVFCEKPLARTSDQAQEMLNAASSNGCRLGVGHVVRFFPEYALAKQRLDEGVLGTIGVVRTFRGGVLFPKGWQDWYARFDCSGGLVLDMIIHDFDFLRWCFGEVARVYAKSTVGRTAERLEYATVVLRFENGVIAHVEGSWSNVPGPFYTTFEVSGSAGMLGYDSRKSTPVTLTTVQSGDQPNVAVPESPLSVSPYLAEIADFVDSILEDRQPLVSAEEGYRSLNVALAALESMRTGRAVTL